MPRLFLLALLALTGCGVSVHDESLAHGDIVWHSVDGDEGPIDCGSTEDKIGQIYHLCPGDDAP